MSSSSSASRLPSTESWNDRLWLLAVAVTILNVLAIFVGVLANWPTQFGGPGTDAGKEFLSSGTAISQPILPAAMLLVVIWRAREPSSSGWAAIIAAYLAALFILVRALGEATAEPTADTSKALMVCSAIVWIGIAAALAVVASAAARERR